ncbi:MAG: ribonuclease HII [Candidatus Aenigmarchaeota archaeon]|nr:ribonuclease HII [Candidatus Aenigmarchaeota archaeon]
MEQEGNGFFIAGIDEAGRGSVIGPMVIVGLSVDQKGEAKLRGIKVRDSKLLSPKRREALYGEIEKIARDIVISKTEPCKIDAYRNSGTNLNRLEAIKFVEILNLLKSHRAYIDGPDVNLARLREFLVKMTNNGTEIIVEHYADVTYPVVSAASIIAKVERDREVEKLKKQYGEVGSGYTSDPRTIAWLKEWLKANDKLPECVRRSWITAELLEDEKKQSRITQWLKARL